jgi:hypothetical protein
VPRAAADTVYHLADGIILSIGPVDTHLVDLERDYEVPIDFRYIDAVERVALGATAAGYESMVPRLLNENILAEGAPAPDDFIRRRLSKLDDIFLCQYESDLSPRERAAHAAVRDAHAWRKRFYERVGQCPVLPETALRRALLVGDAERVGKKDVLCLGDDDLVSVALAMLGHRVTVYDIDDYLLRLLELVCRHMSLDVRIEEHDLRDPLSGVTLEQFDVFLTDPMSNRDCFEIFLSRGLSLLRPGGAAFCAVYAPVNRLFRQITEEMHLPIVRYLARHNRYYSRYFKLHNYESDWVELKKTPDTRVPHAPDQFSVPLNLYREDYHQRRKSFIGYYDGIDEPRFATPLFLDMLLDALENLAKEAIARGQLPDDVRFLERKVHMAQDWTLIHCPMPDGYLTLHVDRRTCRITLDLHPFEPALEETLRQLLLAAYKAHPQEATVSIARGAWDLRVR